MLFVPFFSGKQSVIQTDFFVVVPLLSSYSRLAVVIPSCPVYPARNALQDLLQSALLMKSHDVLSALKEHTTISLLAEEHASAAPDVVTMNTSPIPVIQRRIPFV